MAALSIPTCVHESRFLKIQAPLSQSLGYAFSDRGNLKTALTHRSVVHVCERDHASNERLEFLGDAPLETVVRKYLFEKFPEKSEGELSQLKAILVSKDACHQYALRIGLEKYIMVSDDVPMWNPKAQAQPQAAGTS